MKDSGDPRDGSWALLGLEEATSESEFDLGETVGTGSFGYWKGLIKYNF